LIVISNHIKEQLLLVIT